VVAEVIDKKLLRRRLARAHAGGEARAAFLVEHAVANLAERLAEVERRFPVAVAHSGQSDGLALALMGSGKVDAVYRLEATEAALREARFPGAVGDEEMLPLGAGAIDLFVSTLMLQWTNDLPGALVQIRRSLRPGGLFLAAMTGGQTLAELREALYAAETEISGGASPRVIPTADTRELGALLQRAGFSQPVADRDVLTVRYDSVFGLFRDLQAMGATNVLAERERRPAGRKLFRRAAEIYAERFSDSDGRIRASFEIVWLTGWAPEVEQRPR
jgi:SAM-dependent methyltransferase